MSIKAANLFKYLSECSPKKLREIASYCDNPDDLKHITDLINERDKRLAIKKARTSLLEFTKYTKKDYVAGWANEIIASELDLVLEGKTKRLIIQTSPRIGKSELASRRFPALTFGRDPDHEFITASYSDSLSSKMNKDVQKIMQSQEYMELFPNTRLPKRGERDKFGVAYAKTSDFFQIVGHDGAYKSAGVGTGITGLGGKTILIDDPLKDWKEATSKTTKDMIWDWYNSTAYTRLAPGGAIVIIQTRWSRDDLVGRLLERAKADPNADQWRVVSLPMEFNDGYDYIHELDPRTENGEILFPERFNEKYVNAIRSSLPPKIYVSLYQQQPTVEGGNIFKRNEFKFFKELPEFEYKMLSLDATFKDTSTSDFVVFGVWGVNGKNKYLIETKRDRLDFNATLRVLYTLIAKHPDLAELIIEVKANGDAIVSTINNDPRITIPIFEYSPTESKEARAWAVSPQISAGQVWLPDVLYERNSGETWVEDYLREMTGFPGEKNDDFVDMTTQLLLRVAHTHMTWLESNLYDVNDGSGEEFNQIADIMGWKQGNGFGLGF